VKAATPAGGIAARLVRNGCIALNVTVPGIAGLIGYHRHLERTKGPLPIVAAQHHLAASLRLYPQFTVLDAAPEPVVPADLTSAERLVGLDTETVEQLGQALLTHLVRLRAWQRCANAERRPLLVEAGVTRFDDMSYTSYLLSVDQPWPDPLESFREQFVGTYAGQPIHLSYTDERYRIEIHPLDMGHFD
jgi:hypothetical protein